MKVKVFYLGLLSAVALSQAQGMDKYQRMQKASALEQQVQHHEHVAAQVVPNLDVAAHHNKVEDAFQDIHDKLGVAAAPSGPSANHRVADLHATLGHHGAPADHANKRAEDLAARLGAAAAPTGPSVHEKLTDLMSIQGAVTNDASAVAARTGNVGGGAHDLAGTAIKNEERILARLKAGLAATVAVGRQMETVVDTEGVGTPAGNATVAGDIANANAANNIQAFLAALGW
ncbi:MAG: hypothetical protein K0R76_1539 [Alphaproteobacteria bacterium]|jgi:hypothetical protein|nr:hypothetical protein [Alphaproteobacteria bacterium]